MTTAVRRSLLRDSASYVLVGGVSFVVNAGVLLVLRRTLEWPLPIAVSLSLFAALLVNFAGSRWWAAEPEDRRALPVVRYACLVLLNAVVQTVLVAATEAKWGAGGVVMGVIASTAVMLIPNFVLMRRWVFA